MSLFFSAIGRNDELDVLGGGVHFGCPFGYCRPGAFIKPWGFKDSSKVKGQGGSLFNKGALRI